MPTRGCYFENNKMIAYSGSMDITKNCFLFDGIFEDDLELINCKNTRFYLRSKKTNTLYEMSIAAFYNAACKYGVNKGVLSGKFTFDRIGPMRTIIPVEYDKNDFKIKEFLNDDNFINENWIEDLKSKGLELK